MKQGIRFYMKECYEQDYDPCDSFYEEGSFYNVLIFGYKYSILKEDVIKYEFYPLCEKHGYEKSEKYKCNDCELEK